MKFFIFLLKHKYYVFMAGIIYTKVSLYRLIIHDWSKFTPIEFNSYKNKHYKLQKNQEFTKDDNSLMDAAWLHHQNNNPHHWEYWISRTGHGSEGIGQREVVVEMPEKFVREMVADWMSASRTYGKESKWPSVENWYWLKHFGIKKMRGRLHPNTIKHLNKVFSEIHYKQTLIENDHLFTEYLKLY